jgi:DNA polymerase (family 10)
MLRIPGPGPKRAKEIYDESGITTLADLETAAKSGRLRELPGIKTVTWSRSSQAASCKRSAISRLSAIG